MRVQAGPGRRAVDLSQLSVRVHPGRRLVQLFGGLVLYGFSSALTVRADLGQNPWNVLHQGLANHLGLSFGTVTALVGLLVLLVCFPLRERPGIGTVANIVVISVSLDATLALVPVTGALQWRICLLVGGVVLNGLATAGYVGARLGPGPRDGLMTGLHARTGWSIRVVRTGIEIAVVVTGLLLGGTVGVGTLVYALAIGPLAQFFLPLVAFRNSVPDKGTTVTRLSSVDDGVGVGERTG